MLGQKFWGISSVVASRQHKVTSVYVEDIAIYSDSVLETKMCVSLFPTISV
jgi:hypothetical protein